MLALQTVFLTLHVFDDDVVDLAQRGSVFQQLLSFGVIMLTLGLLGAYLWRTFDAARRRPPYLIERSDGEAPLDRRARR